MSVSSMTGELIGQSFGELYTLKVFSASHNEIFEFPDVLDTLSSLEVELVSDDLSKTFKLPNLTSQLV